MTQKRRSALEPKERATQPPPLPPGRADARGPRIVDPFACETLAYPRLSPLVGVLCDPSEEPTLVRAGSELPKATAVLCEPLEEPTLMQPRVGPFAAVGAPGEPLEDPTLLRRPWAREFALEPLVPAVDGALAKTIARPVMSPLAVTVRAPAAAGGAGPSDAAAARPAAARRSAADLTVGSTARTPLVRKCIAGLLVAALLLLGVRALIARQRTGLAKAAAPAVSASSRAVTAASASPSARAASADERPKGPAGSPPPSVNGKTAQRQAVDLVARGAYAEAAVLYDRLARWNDVPAFREAARIARRKARLAR